jgi:hypothetical protein
VRSLLGTVTYKRLVYECPRTRRQVAPLDQELGLEAGAVLTHGVVSKVAWAGARSSYSGAAEDLRRLAGIEVSRAEFARVVNEQGERVLALQDAREERWSEPVAGDRPVFAPDLHAQRLVIEADATIALTVAGEEHKAVYCGRAFDAAARADKNGRALLADSRFAASAVDLEDFKHRLDALANRCGARQAKAVAFIADGAPALWKLAEDRFSFAVHIQDYWHVAEHLHALAKALFGEATQEAAAHAARWCALLKDSRIDDVIAELDALRKTARGAKREAIEAQLGYLRAGRHRMDYKAYAAAGWPIGSGAIEATCKHLAKERLGATGARWRRSTLPNIMALRLCRANDEWDRDFAPQARAA